MIDERKAEDRWRVRQTCRESRQLVRETCRVIDQSRQLIEETRRLIKDGARDVAPAQYLDERRVHRISGR